MRRGLVALAMATITGGCATDPPPQAASASPDTPPTTATTVVEASTTSEFLSTTSTTEPFVPTVFCFAEPPPPYGRAEAPYQFDPDFYVHYCSASGIFVVGSAKTPLVALEAAAQVVDRMIGHDPHLVEAMILANHAVILTGEEEHAGDLPEWGYEEGRTFAPDPEHPGFTSTGGGLTYAVAPADDVLCDVPPERHGSYGTPDWGVVLIHELGHLVEDVIGLTDLEALYEVGRASGAWHPRHYAMSHPREYWAEVVQVYLGQYEHRRRGLAQPITRTELRESDPTAFDLAASIFERSTLVHYWCDTYRGPVTELPDESDAVETG